MRAEGDPRTVAQLRAGIAAMLLLGDGIGGIYLLDPTAARRATQAGLTD